MGEDIIKMNLQDVGWGVMVWIVLAQYRERWRVFVNVVMNLHFRKMRIISCLAEDLLASKEGMCCIESME